MYKFFATQFRALKPGHRFAARYVVVGGVNTVIGLLMFPALQTLLGPLGVHYLVTLCVAQFINVTLSFVMLRHFVFQVAQTSFLQFALHNAFHWVYFLCNLVLLPLLVQSSGKDPRIVQFLLSILAMALALLWQRHIVFKKKEGH